MEEAKEPVRETFNGHELTDLEAALRAKGKCVCCGRPAPKKKSRRGFTVQSFECKACAQMREPGSLP